MKNNVEEKFISKDNVEPIHLDVADFFEKLDGEVYHITGDGPVIVLNMFHSNYLYELV